MAVVLGRKPGGAGGGPTSGLFDAYAYLRDERASGTDGGDTVANTWVTRTLNTEVFDSDNIVTLAGNQFTLQAGAYFVRARGPVWKSGADCRHKIRIRNITDGTTAAVGSSAFSANADSAMDSVLRGRIVIAAQKTFELQHRANQSQLGEGLGVDASTGEVEVYGEVEIWREA